MDGDPVGDVRLVTGQGPQPDAQRVRQRLREGRQQHAGLRVSPGQGRPPDAMPRSSCRCRPTAADPGGSVVVALDEPPLRRMQEDRPFIPRVIERAFQFLDVGQHAEPALRVGMGERDRPRAARVPASPGVVPVARFNSASAASCGRCSAMSNSVSSLASPDLVEPFGRHAITEQRIVVDPGEQQRLAVRAARSADDSG